MAHASSCGMPSCYLLKQNLTFIILGHEIQHDTACFPLTTYVQWCRASVRFDPGLFDIILIIVTDLRLITFF